MVHKEGDIGRLQILMKSMSEEHRSKPALLNLLATAFTSRYDSYGILRDLDRGIHCLKPVLRLIPEGHPDELALLTNLGNCFILRFQRLGEELDANRAITQHQ